MCATTTPPQGLAVGVGGGGGGKGGKKGERPDKPVKASKLGAGDVCFNCGGNHPVRDCPMPKDQGAIDASLAAWRQKGDNKQPASAALKATAKPKAKSRSAKRKRAAANAAAGAGETPR